MNNLLKYKGYYGSMEISLEDKVLHGKIECINDLVTYEAQNVDALQSAFEVAVDDYLETCAEIGKEPDRTMSGTFNVRIGEILHKKAYLKSCSLGVTLNEFVRLSVSEKLDDKKEVHIHFEQKASEHPHSMSFSAHSRTRSGWSSVINRGESQRRNHDA